MVWGRFLLIISGLTRQQVNMSRSIGQEDDEGVGWESVCLPREAMEWIESRNWSDCRKRTASTHGHTALTHARWQHSIRVPQAVLQGLTRRPHYPPHSVHHHHLIRTVHFLPLLLTSTSSCSYPPPPYSLVPPPQSRPPPSSDSILPPSPSEALPSTC